MAEDRNLTIIQRLASAYPETKTLLDYLTNRNAVPEKEAKGTMTGATGEFQYGNTSDMHRTLRVGPAGKIRMQPAANAGTFIHELTHAADLQMDAQYHEDVGKAGRKENQFTRAYNRLRFNPSFDQNNRNNFEKMVNLLAPNFAAEQGDYRASNLEVRAFAVGDSVAPEGKFATPIGRKEIPPHLNATMATEFMILLELANRETIKKPTPAAPTVR